MSEAPFNKRHTAEDLTRIRSETVTELLLHGRSPAVFTCDVCPWRHECAYVFDAYNTEGDCLAIK